MSAKVRRIIDLGSIYIKTIGASKKIPTCVLAKSSAVGSISSRRTWGIGSRKNLMKVRLVCRSVKSVSWVVKKAFSQSRVGYGGHRVSIVASKSSFYPEEPKRKSRKAIVGVIGPGAHIYVYIGPEAQSEDIKWVEDE